MFPCRPHVAPTVALLAGALALAGCAKREDAREPAASMTMEELDALADTTGLSRGGPARGGPLEVARGADGTVRASGAVALPDGTRGQLVVYAEGTPAPVGRSPFRLADGRFENIVLRDASGDLAPGIYQVEVTVLLSPAVQPEDVIRALGDPARLRGPGITRDRVGGAAFTHRAEFRL